MAIKIGVAIELPPSIAQAAHDLATCAVRATPMESVLDKRSSPHLVLWEGVISAARVPKEVVAAFDKYSDTSFEFDVTMAPGLTLNNNGDVVWEALRPTHLLIIHRITRRQFFPFTIPTPSHIVGGYSPKIVIGRAKNTATAKKVIGEIMTNTHGFKPPSILLGVMGTNGHIVDAKARYIT